MPLSVPEAVPGAVALVLQRVERLVLDAPAGAGGAHDRHEAVAVDGKVGDPGEPPLLLLHPVGRVVRAAVAPRDAFPPGDRLPVFDDAGPDVGMGGVDWRAVQVAEFVQGAVGVGEPGRAGVRAGGGAVEQQRVVAGSPPGDEAEAVPPQAGDVGSVGREAVLQDDGLQVRMLPPEVVDGPRRGVAPAVVSPVPVGPGDRLRGQREHLPAVGMADHGGEHAVRMGPRPVTAAGEAAVVAVDGFRAEWPVPSTGIRQWPSKTGWSSSTLPRCSLANRVPTPVAAAWGRPCRGVCAWRSRRAPPRSRTASGGSRGRWRPCGCPCRTAGATDTRREHRERRHEVVTKAEPAPVHRIVDRAETFRQRPDRPGPAEVLPKPHRPNSRQ